MFMGCIEFTRQRSWGSFQWFSMWCLATCCHSSLTRNWPNKNKTVCTKSLCGMLACYDHLPCWEISIIVKLVFEDYEICGNMQEELCANFLQNTKALPLTVWVICHAGKSPS
uniref:Secreted protein n=1 Tax=Amblyomma americanum TaxID=6943 RepID=A0A0C9RW91_AMBAM